MRRLAISVLASVLWGCQSTPPAPAPAPSPPRVPTQAFPPPRDIAGDLRTTMRKQVVDMAITDEDYLKTNTERRLMEVATTIVRNQMKDPAGAQLRNVRVVRIANGRVVCGEVNGKNAYGGYVGFAPFVASNVTATLYSSGSRYADLDVAGNVGIVESCTGK